MTQKLFALLLSLLIFACPFKCMQSSAEVTDSGQQNCCQHCPTQSTENPLAPVSDSSKGCQCFCSGAILEHADQLEQSQVEAFWFVFAVQPIDSPQYSVDASPVLDLSDTTPPAGRVLRCLCMSFQC